MDRIRQDLRITLRQLRRSPGLAILAVAVLTFAVGIWASPSIFSAVDGVVLRPLPHPGPHRVVSLGENCRKAEGMLPPDLHFVPGSCFPCNARTLRATGATT